MTTPGEQNLARRLTHPEKSERDAGFKLMESWVEALGKQASPSGTTPSASREEMLKLWKALFYCVWMSDKTIVQQELIVRVAALVSRLAGACAPKHQSRVGDFVGAFFDTIRREWLGLDRYRVDKFMSLIRRMVYESLLYCARPGLGEGARAGVEGELERALLLPPMGVSAHVAGVFIAELAATGAVGPKSTHAATMRLLTPLFAALPKAGGDRVGLEHFGKEAFREGLLWSLQAVRDPGSEAAEVAREAALAAAAPPAPTPELVGLPPESRVDPFAGELSFLLQDRKSRESAAQGAFKSVNIAALAVHLFALGAEEKTPPPSRELAYALHKDFKKLALKCGDAKKEEDCYPSLPSFTPGVPVKPISAPKRKIELVQKEEEEEVEEDEEGEEELEELEELEEEEEEEEESARPTTKKGKKSAAPVKGKSAPKKRVSWGKSKGGSKGGGNKGGKTLKKGRK
jgi:ribosomal RNA-processing protein 1